MFYWLSSGTGKATSDLAKGSGINAIELVLYNMKFRVVRGIDI